MTTGVYATASAGAGARSMDRVAVREGPGWIALALADGAGGTGGGEAAAEAVVACLADADVPAWISSQGVEAASALVALVRLPGGSLQDDVSLALLDRPGAAPGG